MCEAGLATLRTRSAMSLDLRLTLGVSTVHSECEVLSKRGVLGGMIWLFGPSLAPYSKGNTVQTIGSENRVESD